MENYNNYDNSADDSIAMESVLAEPLIHKGVLTRSKETIVRQKNKLAVAALVLSLIHI